jgi:hypothetical protein
MSRDITEYIRSCDVCQRAKAKRHKPFGTLQPLPPPTTAWRHFSIDFITDLPSVIRDGRTYDAILVIVDRFTKLATYFPVNKTINSETLADLIWKNIALKTGSPLSIVSDRGTVFTSEYWSTFCFRLNIVRRLSTSFHPQTDGQTERMNQELENHLRMYCGYQQENWVDLLDTAAYAYNSKFQSSIGMSPIQCAYNAASESLDGIREQTTSGCSTAAEHIASFTKLQEKARDHLQHAQDLQKKYYDRGHKDQHFDVGQQVLLRAKNIKTARPCKKLDDKYLGPFEILERKGAVAYKLALPQSMSRLHNVFHVSLLEPYHRRDGAQPPAVPELDEEFGSDVFEVQDVVDHKHQASGTLYRVRWLGYGSEHDSWLQERELDNCQELLATYKSRHEDPNRTSRDSPHVTSAGPPRDIRGLGTTSQEQGGKDSGAEKQRRGRGRPRGSKNKMNNAR